MRRLLAAGLLAVMLTATACSKAKPTAPKGDLPTSAVKSTAGGGPVTLRVLDYGDTAAIDALITAFYQQNPNVRVEKVLYQPPAGDPRPYDAALINEHKVDIVPGMFVSPDVIGVDKFLDLDPFIQKSRLDLTALATDPDALRVQGNLYELPYAVQPSVVVYNKAMFQSQGVPFPQAGWTWDQLRETAAKLTRGSGDQKVWGLAPASTDMLGSTYLHQEDPKHMMLSDDNAIKQMLQLFGTMIQTDRSVPPSTSQDPTRGQDLSHRGDFVNGRAAMTIDFLQRFRQPDQQPSFPWDVVPLPTRAGAKTKGYGWASSFAIAANTPDPDSAWAFVRFAASPAGAVALARAGYLPLYNSTEVRQAWLQMQPAPPAGTAGLFDVRWIPLPHYWDDRILSTIYDAYVKAIGETLSGTTSWQDAYADYRVAVLTRH